MPLERDYGDIHEITDDGGTRARKVIIVGGGFRTASLLSSRPSLLTDDLVVLEATGSFGVGAFSNYDAWTTSLGSRFFAQAATDGPLSRLSEHAAFIAVSKSDHPVDMASLSEALAAQGTVLAQELGSRLILNSPVTGVEVRSSSHIIVRTVSEKEYQAETLVLATGRAEVLEPELEPFCHKVLMSEAVIDKQFNFSTLLAGDNGGRSIVIVGCSHSAMTVVARIEAHYGSMAAPRVPIQILQRTPTRIMYDSFADALKEFVPARELQANEETDVCPATGIVFRDSGLRNQSKYLYRRIWENKVQNVSVVPGASIASSHDLLAQASMIIQATGYKPKVPPLSVYGQLVSSPETVLTAADDGTAIVNDQKIGNLVLLRVGQTPRNKRDSAVYGANLYSDIAERLSKPKGARLANQRMA